MEFPREYVGVAFRHRTKGKTYTYHNDGPRVGVGDMVRVPEASGDGWSRGWVVSITNRKPPFDTKPILGKLEYAA